MTKSDTVVSRSHVPTNPKAPMSNTLSFINQFVIFITYKTIDKVRILPDQPKRTNPSFDCNQVITTFVVR